MPMAERINDQTPGDAAKPGGRPHYWNDTEAQLDEALIGLGRLLRRKLNLIVLPALIGALFYLYIWPTHDQWLPVIAEFSFFFVLIVFSAAGIIIQFAVLFWFLGRGRTYWVKPGETGVTFADYRGNPEVLESAGRIVTLLRGVKEFQAMGGENIRGLLLIGPPGTGKSYLAQAISTEAGVPFGYASAPSFQNMFLGISNLRVMMLYRKARKLARRHGACILFIDEIDAIAAQRNNAAGGAGGLFGGNSAMLNELLLQMDPPPQELSRTGRLLRSLGMRRRKVETPPVLTIGATNLPDVLDPALLRPGRFDRQILVDKPNAEGRRDVLTYYLGKVACDPALPLDYLVHDTIGYTPATIRYVINEAVIHAHFAGRSQMIYADFTAARELHELGLRQPILGMSEEERRRIAYHEAGHGVAGYILRPKTRVVKLAIVRHAQALGMAMYKPSEESYTRVKDDFLADIQVALAARAAEELFLGIQMDGVTGDLQLATRRATEMVNAFGMAGSLYSSLTFGVLAPDLPTRRKVERILDHQYASVKRLLEANAPVVDAIAAALLVHDELNELQISEIMERFVLVMPEPLPEPTWTEADEQRAIADAQQVTMPATVSAEAAGDG
jgi:ATP-dependent Zn protease